MYWNENKVYLYVIDTALIIVGNKALGYEKGTNLFGGSNSISEHNIQQEVSRSDSFHNSGYNSIPEKLISKESHKIPSNVHRKILPVNLWKIYIIKTSIG